MFQERADSITTRLFTYTVAYLVTRNSTFANEAKSMTLSLTKWKDWTDPDYTCGTACLDTGHLVQVINHIYISTFVGFLQQIIAKK